MSLALLFAAQTAFAANPDLTTTITPPSSYAVDTSAAWTFKVSNISNNKDAAGTKLFIQLPATNTSPTVHVMGALGTISTTAGTCSRSGTLVTCNVGTVRKTKSVTVTVNIALPQSAGTLDFSTTATTTTAGDPTGNNTDAEIGSPTYVTVAAPTVDTDVDNSHCTGTGLEAYYECTLYPSSLSSHVVTFEADGDISIAGYPEYFGQWTVSGTELDFYYATTAGVEVEFVGNGVDSGTENCWEGLSEFPDGSGGYSAYVSPYRVCL